MHTHTLTQHTRVTYPFEDVDLIMSLLIGLLSPLGFSFVNSMIFGEARRSLLLLLSWLLLLLLLLLAREAVVVEGELMSFRKDVRVSGGPGVIDRITLGFIGLGFVEGEGGAESEGSGNTNVGEVVAPEEGSGDTGADMEEGEGEEEREEAEGETGKRGDEAREMSLGAGDEEGSPGAGQLGRSLLD